MAKILVVDDEEMILSLAERILKRDEHEVLTAENSASAIEIFKQQYESIDIVILDMNMDDLNGFQLLSKFREISPEIHCVISSGDSCDKTDIPDDVNKNIHFLQKPYRANILAELVKSIVINA